MTVLEFFTRLLMCLILGAVGGSLFLVIFVYVLEFKDWVKSKWRDHKLFRSIERFQHDFD